MSNILCYIKAYEPVPDIQAPVFFGGIPENAISALGRQIHEDAASVYAEEHDDSLFDENSNAAASALLALNS